MDTDEDDEPEVNVILLCPVCASPLDAAAQTMEQTLECDCCGQIWEMVVDAERNARHSLT